MRDKGFGYFADMEFAQLHRTAYFRKNKFRFIAFTSKKYKKFLRVTIGTVTSILSF